MTALTELAWLLFPADCSARLLVFGAFFDDSGTHDEAPVAALAGYVAPIAVWEGFSVQWNRFLGQHGLDFHHATDCCSSEGRGQYRDWSENERRDIHKEAVEIITAHELIAVGASIAAQPFRKWYFDDLVVGERILHKPQYHYCFELVVRLLADKAVVWRPDERVSLVLEKTPKVIGNVTDTFERLMAGDLEPAKERFSGTPTMQPKKGWPQLQAADVLAYEMALDLRWNWNPDRKYGTRKSFRALSNHSDRMGGILYFEGIPDSDDNPLIAE